MQRRIPVLFSSLFFFLAVTAQEKYRALQWSLKEGLSQACVYHMLKDVNGFLWVGTQGGLSRFDGSVFKKYYYDPQKTGTINAKATYGGLVEDSLHNIWIGTEKDLYRYDIKADSFTRFLNAAPLLATRNEIFYIERGGSIFTYNVHSFAKKKQATLIPADSIWAGLGLSYSFFDEQSNSLWMLRGDHQNNRWSGGGLLQISLTTGEKKYYSWNCYKNIPGHDHSAESMCYDRKKNCLWINSSEGLMQFTLDDQQFHFTGALNSFFNTKDYGRWVGISMDIQGRVWLATQPKGIVIYDPSNQSVSFPFADDSPLQKEISDNNATIYCDRDGITWSGFWLGKGIYQVLPFSPSIKHYKTETAIFNIGDVINFQNAANGKMWINSRDWSIHRVFDTHNETIRALEENNLPPSLRRMAFHALWIDTIAGKAYLDCLDKGIWVLDMNNNKCQPLIFKDTANHEIIISQLRGTNPFKDGLLISTIQNNGQSIFFVNSESMAAHEALSFPVNPGNEFYLEMADDRFLFLRGFDEAGNLTYTYRNNKWTRSPNPLDSIPWNHIIYNKSDQGYWVVSEKQLIHYSKDFRVIHVYTPKDGLPELDIYSLLPDTKGNIWFNTDRSIHQLNIETGVFSTLSEKDGFHPQNFSVDPAIYMSTGGDLYLGGGVDGNGFVRISPENYSNTSSSVFLRSLEVNQKPFQLSTGVNDLQELSLRYFENKITIETGIIDYYSKGSSHIRYKLEALNDNWQYGPANYTIRYDGLQPGSYTLLMQSSNAANEFIGPVKILKIHISPPFWQTWWFRTLIVITLLFILYGIYRWRTAALRNQKRILEQTVKERTAEVVEEKAEVERQKEKSDELLLNILPSEVAEELKEKGYTTAKSFDEVTVLFSDIKGFTHVAENMTAQGLVKEIDTYFSAFDGIMQKNGLEKIKTIGDAYIAAGGLPEKNSATAQNVVEAAIAMQQAVEKLKQERISSNKPYFELRIGIHTGPVVAGVVGIKKFQYDIWGDTVNLAARMEQSGVPGKINISQNTYEVVKGQFTCVHRGKIEAKNKGEIDMYFVE